MTSLSSGLAGLSLLTGADAFSAAAASLPTVETRAQRKAKAAFTTPETTAPWKEAPSKVPASQQLAAVLAMRTIVDKAGTGGAVLPTDVQTSFTTYKALDRLRLLAEAAAKDTTGSAERTRLQAAFAKGMGDLRTFLVAAPSEQMDLSFARAAREVSTVAVASPSSLSAATIAGKGVRDARTGALDGVKGDEVLRISLSQAGGVADTLTVDLSTASQPPTLDGVADAINAAIRAIPRRDKDGNTVLDAQGQPVPRWAVKVEPDKFGEKWGLSIKRAGFETIAIDQVGAGDALMVAGGVSATGEAMATRIARFDDPAGALDRRTYPLITATDAAATERSKMAADDDKTGKLKAKVVAAGLSADAIATDAQGFSYVVGATKGDVAANRSNGSDDLLLTKVDSEGTVVWQRNLGAAGSARGAAVTIAADGGVVIAGTVSGGFDGANSDGDMAVARYDGQGNETFSTLIRAIGGQSASAVAVGADGSIFVGGNTEGGDAVVARLDSAGKLAERRVIDGGGTDTVKALAVDGSGKLLVLTGESGRATLRRLNGAALTGDLAKLDLGQADARALAVAANGRIAVVGATDAALPGAQANGPGGKRDAFLARIDANLSGASISYIATAAEDQADSVGFLGDAIYVGGRTAGAFGSGAKTGTVDGFVARVDAATGNVADVRQFGTIGAATASVELSAVKGGNSVLGALGLHRGTLTPTDSVTLEAQTSVRAGNEFAIRVNGGALRKIVIGDNETLTTLADRIRTLAGKGATVTTPAKDTGRTLRITTRPGQEIELVAGTSGRDALAKLGLSARRISTPAEADDDAPKVRPGGSFGLDLSDAIRVDTKTDAAVALARVKQAISYTQSAYRSLYWDDAKAALADTTRTGGRKGGSTVIEQAQLANYQAALTRLSSPSTSYGF